MPQKKSSVPTLLLFHQPDGHSLKDLVIYVALSRQKGTEYVLQEQAKQEN